MNKHEKAKSLPWIANPFRLWSLEDMLKVSAAVYMVLGENIALMDVLLAQNKIGNLKSEDYKRCLANMKENCEEIGLNISVANLSRAIIDLPQSEREWKVIRNTIEDELSSHLFFFVPPYRANYFEQNQSINLTTTFSGASRELVRAGNCFAKGEYTACVFHAMRATEICLRSFGKHLSVRPPKGIEFSQWAEILNAINGKLKLMRNSKGTKARNEKLGLIRFFRAENST